MTKEIESNNLPYPEVVKELVIIEGVEIVYFNSAPDEKPQKDPQDKDNHS